MITNAPTLDDITVSGGGDLREIAACLRKYGAAVLPGYIEPDQLTRLSAEWDKLRAARNDGNPAIRRVGGDVADYAALDRTAGTKAEFPAIEAVFDNDRVRSLVREVVGFPCMLNSEIYATYDVGADRAIADAHFDKTWNLKFMVYLEDIMESGKGAFGVHPGSMGEARRRFREWFDGICRDGAVDVGTDEFYSMPNERLPNNLAPFVEILAPRGSLIIFNTDVYHSGSYLKAGCERRILRAHTYPGERLLGIGDKMPRNSRHYERGEKWEKTGKGFSRFSKEGLGEWGEKMRLRRLSAQASIKSKGVALMNFIRRCLYIPRRVVARLVRR